MKSFRMLILATATAGGLQLAQAAVTSPALTHSTPAPKVQRCIYEGVLKPVGPDEVQVHCHQLKGRIYKTDEETITDCIGILHQITLSSGQRQWVCI